MPNGFSDTEKYLQDMMEQLTVAGMSHPEKMTAAYRDYLVSLQGVIDLTRRYYTQDVNGVFPLVNKGDNQALQEAYQKAINAGRAYLKQGEENADVLPEVRDIVLHVDGLLLKDAGMLKAMENRAPQTLPSMVGQARGISLNVPAETEFSTVGGLSSSRIPIAYTDSAGVKHQGFFTQKKVVDRDADIEKLVSGVEKKSPETGALIREWMKDKDLQFFFSDCDNIRVSLTSGKPKVSEFFFGNMQDSATAEQKEMILNVLNDPEALGLLKGFVNDIRQVAISNIQYGTNLHLDMKTGRRIDSRNTAMSEMAKLLGVPELLAASSPMTLHKGDEVIEGTFMEKAVGVDRAHIRPGDPILKYNAMQDPDGAWKKNYFDLMILDFVCQNMDRHEKNMFYQFDLSDPEHPKFVGVQGIDNDMSFGANKITNGKQDLDFGLALGDLKVCSETMAKSIRNLDEAAIRASLINCDLKEDEINAVCERTKLLQERLRSMHIVKDEEWKNITYDDVKPVYSSDKPQNIMTRMFSEDGGFKKDAEANGMKEEKEIHYLETHVEHRTDESYAEQMRRKTEDLANLAYDNKHWYLRNGKKEYDEMYHAMQELQAASQNLNGEASAEELAGFARKLEKAGLCAQEFLKKEKNPKGKSAEGRVQAAGKVLEFARVALKDTVERLEQRQLDTRQILSDRVGGAHTYLASVMDKRSKADPGKITVAAATVCLEEMIRSDKSGDVLKLASEKGLDAAIRSLLKTETFKQLFKNVYEHKEKAAGIVKNLYTVDKKHRATGFQILNDRVMKSSDSAEMQTNLRKRENLNRGMTL